MVRFPRHILPALLLVVAIGGTGCSAPPAPPGSESPTPFPGTVDVGGHRLWASCSGTGSPTIVLEGGDEDDHSGWFDVAPGLLKQTRVCQYDRLGLGLSDAATGCRELADFNADLEALLGALGEKGPYILVGASGGGYLTAGFAMGHADEIAGIVLLDTMQAIDTSTAPPDLLADIKCDAPSNIEHRDYAAVEHAAWDDKHLVGDIPLTVISNDYGDAAENEEERNSVAGQRGWFALSPQAKQVVVTSGHDMTHNESDLVVEEVLAVLTAARSAG
jgi:pimeloyl-ACP methyl ester carboxylesterase